MVRANFFWFLRRSIDLLEEEAYKNFALLAAELVNLRSMVSSGSTTRVAFFDRNKFIITEELGYSDIVVRFANDAVVIDLIDAKYSFTRALLSGDVFVRGNIDILNKFNLALAIYLDGAIRSPSFDELLSQYRSGLSKCVSS
jgi:hypothetical protein